MKEKQIPIGGVSESTPKKKKEQTNGVQKKANKNAENNTQPPSGEVVV